MALEPHGPRVSTPEGVNRQSKRRYWYFLILDHLASSTVEPAFQLVLRRWNVASASTHVAYKLEFDPLVFRVGNMCRLSAFRISYRYFLTIALEAEREYFKNASR